MVLKQYKFLVVIFSYRELEKLPNNARILERQKTDEHVFLFYFKITIYLYINIFLKLVSPVKLLQRHLINKLISVWLNSSSNNRKVFKFIFFK